MHEAKPTSPQGSPWSGHTGPATSFPPGNGCVANGSFASAWMRIGLHGRPRPSDFAPQSGFDPTYPMKLVSKKNGISRNRPDFTKFALITN
jgi:hypothetical protein